MGLSSSDPGVDHGTQHDQLNLLDLALGEAVSRRLQLWEKRYTEKLRASAAGGVSAVFRRSIPRNDISSWAELDQFEAKLEKWVASQLAEEAAILKEKRKGREERELVAVGSDPRGRNHRKPPKSRCYLEAVARFVHGFPTGYVFLPGFEHFKEKVWLRSAVDAINELGSRVLPPRGTPTSANRLELAGVAPVGVTVQDAVIHVLGQDPGFVDDMATGKLALFKRGLASLPRVQAG